MTAANFKVTKVPIDPQNNIVMGWGYVTGNNDYATGTWKIKPEFLGLHTIYAVNMSAFMRNSTATTPILNLICLQDLGDGTYGIELYEDWAADTADDADGFSNVKLQLFFIGVAAPSAYS